MLTHAPDTLSENPRLVIFGASGFVGSRLADLCRKAGRDVYAPTSSDINLSSAKAEAALKEALRPGDQIVVLSALTPDRGKDHKTYMANLHMVDALASAIETVVPCHVLYISSDAVYPLTGDIVSELTPAAPTDLYAMMHLSREIVLQSICADKLAILRPTLIFGAADTHNSYGPNRFRRQAQAGGPITLGGEGEETRDHITVEDAVSLIYQVIEKASVGVLNIATGQSRSFMEVAKLVAEAQDGMVEIKTSDRNMPVTYRSFDISALHRAFPDFRFSDFETAIRKVADEA